MINYRHSCILPVNPYQNYFLKPYCRNHDRVLISLYELRGEQICSRVEHAWKKVIERHDGLRISFYQEDNELYQVIHQEIPFTINYHLKDTDKSFAELTEKYCSPFNIDLEKPPLFQVHMFYKDVNYYWMLVKIHHAIIDGTSASILFRDLFLCMQMHMLAEKFPTHYNYSIYLQSYLQSEAMQRQGRYWENKLLAKPVKFDLPTDYQKESTEDKFAKTIFTFNVNGLSAQKLDLFIKENHMTKFSFFAGVFSLLLYEYSLCEEVIYISPVSQRKHADFREVVSALINYIVISIKIDENESIGQFFKRNLREVFAALANMEYPFLYIKEKISAQPIKDVIFLYQNFANGIGSYISEDALTSISIINSKSLGAARILRLELLESPDGYFGSLSCHKKLFKTETAAHFLRRYQSLLEQIIIDKELPIKTLIQQKGYA